MDPRELTADFEEYMRVLFLRHQSGLWTALPVIVDTWNYPVNGQNTVHVAPAIKGVTQNITDGTHQDIAQVLLQDVPVKFLGGGNFNLTHPIKKGDEGHVIFSSRNINGWWSLGGVQPRPQEGQARDRMHDLSDGLAFHPAKLSKAAILPAISTTSAQLRSDDGKSYVEMLDNGAGFNFVTPNGYLKFDGATGNLKVSGNIFWNDKTASTDAAGHKHGSVMTGGNETDIPVAGT
jgi:hypothetical protein